MSVGCKQVGERAQPRVATQLSLGFVDMAFVTISGFPSSGKSRLAAALKADWERRIVEAASNLSVVVLEDDIGPEGRAIYQGQSPILDPLSTLSRLTLWLIHREREGEARPGLASLDRRPLAQQEHHRHLRCHELHQGLSVSDAPGGQGGQRPLLHRELPSLSLDNKGHLTQLASFKIHVAAPPEKCREWNSSRNPSEAYPDSV